MRTSHRLFASLLLTGIALAAPVTVLAQGEPGGGFEPPPETGGFTPPDAGGFTPPDAAPAQAGFGAPAGNALANILSTPEAVKQLYEFRYIEITRWDGSVTVERRSMTTEEAAAFDRERIAGYAQAARNGTLPWYPAGNAGAQAGPEGAGAADPDLFAKWSLYAEQLALWTDYVERFALAGKKPTRTLADFKFPGDPTGGEGQEGQNFVSREGSAERLVEKNQFRSMDDQVGDFFTPGGGNEAGGQQQVAWTHEDLDKQATSLYQAYAQDLKELEEDQLKYLVQLDARLGEREIQRKAYDDWRLDQQFDLQAVVEDWQRRYEGQVSVIDGVRYELYRPGTVPNAVTRGAQIVETNFVLTPYDILNEDGTLKGNARN